MVASSASRRYSQRLGESCWSSVVEKPRTAFQNYSMGMFAMFAVQACGSGPKNQKKFESICWWCKIDQKLIKIMQKNYKKRFLFVPWFHMFHQDLSSMLVVKPDGSCLAQSDAVVFARAQDCLS